MSRVWACAVAFISPEQSAATLGSLPSGAVVMEVESGRPVAKAGEFKSAM
jgi:hypothetical protein